MGLLRYLNWVGWVAAPFLVGAGEVTPVLRTTSGCVEFTVGERGAFVSRYEGPRDGGERAWVRAEPRVPLWSVTVQEYSGDRSTVTALSGPARVAQLSPARLEITWAELKPGKVTVTMAVSVRGDDLLWGLEASTKEDDCALWTITFPELGPVARPEGVHSITTSGWGLVHDDLPRRPLYDRVYPSARCSMPFVALSDGHAGLYLGAEDQAGFPLGMFVGRAPGASAVTLGMRHDPPDMGNIRSYQLPYTVVTTAYAGDWYEAAQLYRRAAMNSAWGGVRPLAHRRDVPAWLRDTDLWYMGPCEDERSAAGVIDFTRYFGVPTSAHVYNWHQIPFDDRYPEYFPAKSGFPDAVAKVQAAGIAVMPYINSRLWDAKTTSWRETRAGDAAALGLNGAQYSEDYGAKVPLTPMCPTTGLWQDTVVRLVDRLVNEVGVRAVYLDQIAAAPACRCFAANHGHPVGGGTYWIAGYRELLRRCLAVLPWGAALTTEENADPWNDQLQAFLLVNTQPRGGQIVPLYPAVYGGRVVSFGFQYLSDQDFELAYPGRLKFAREFVFGSQMGWVGPSILNPKHEREAAFLRRLCQVRHGARDALQLGRLLPPVGLESTVTVSWRQEVEGSIHTETAPSVVATAWLTPDGTRKLAAANVADVEVIATLNLEDRHAGDLAADALVLQAPSSPTAPERTVAILRQTDRGRYQGELRLPARDALVLEIVGAPGARCHSEGEGSRGYPGEPRRESHWRMDGLP